MKLSDEEDEDVHLDLEEQKMFEIKSYAAKSTSIRKTNEQILAEYVYDQCKALNNKSFDINAAILKDLAFRREEIKDLMLQKEYKHVLNMLNKACFKYMMPTSIFDETRFTPYNTKAMDEYNLKSYINISKVETDGKTYFASQVPYSKNIDVFIRLLTNSNTRTVVSLIHYKEYLKTFSLIESKKVHFGEKLLYFDELYEMQGRDLRVLRFDNWVDHSTISKEELEFFYETSGGFNHYPILVHCRAGIGRTGFFIMYDILKDKQKVDLDYFLDVLFKLRSCRSGMVWSVKQLSDLVDIFLDLN